MKKIVLNKGVKMPARVNFQKEGLPFFIVALKIRPGKSPISIRGTRHKITV